jgi:hypothetical protein
MSRTPSASVSPTKAGRIAFAALCTFALVVLPLAIYAAGYFWLGELSQSKLGQPTSARVFESYWQMRLFKPAGKLEAWLRGCKVWICYQGADGIVSEH